MRNVKTEIVKSAQYRQHKVLNSNKQNYLQTIFQVFPHTVFGRKSYNKCLPNAQVQNIRTEK